MIVFPNAKINLGLQVTGKLTKGYHTIQSVLYPIPLYDALEFIPIKKKTVFQSSGLDIPKDGKDNLVLQAYQLLKKDFQLPEISIFLHKNIPMGAGLGGGSSDAAFMLRALNDYFELFLADSFLESYAEQLGSDCPFFISNTPALATGTGTELSEINVDLQGFYLLLVNPGVHISTQEAYAKINPQPPQYDISDLVVNHSPEFWKARLQNDFEQSIFEKYPLLHQLKESFYEQGAVYSSMSGSGSTIFGLFKEKPPEAFEKQLRNSYVTFSGSLP